MQSPPLPPERRTELLRRSALGRRFLEVSARTPLEFVREEFEHDVVRAGLLFFNGMREIDLQAPGFGHSIAAILAGRHKAQMCLGGSARLAEALVEDIREHGGEIRTGVQPKAILTRKGRAIGVELAAGERDRGQGLRRLRAQPAADVPGSAGRGRGPAADARGRCRLPLQPDRAVVRPESVRCGSRRVYAAAERSAGTEPGLHGHPRPERMDQFHEMVTAHQHGEIPPRSCGERVRPCSTPARRLQADTLRSCGRSCPTHCSGDARTGTRNKRRMAGRCWPSGSRFAPNLAEDGTVLDAFTRSPLDTERSLPNMRSGDLLVGSLSDGQVGYNRPFPGAGQYRTPVGGLYLVWRVNASGGQHHRLVRLQRRRGARRRSGLEPWWYPPQANAPGRLDEVPPPLAYARQR